MNNKYSIYEPNFGTLTAKLMRLNAKLVRINIAPITWKQVGYHDAPHPEIEHAVVRYIDLEVEGVVPAENGWSFVATVVHTDDGNIIRTVPGYTVPAEYRDRPTWCEHCKTNRARRDTYIVRHAYGHVMQVGSSCLADFIGTQNPNRLTKASEILLNAFDVCDAAQKREWLGGSNGISTYRIDLDTFLQHVAAVVLKEGRYVTRKMARESEEAVSFGTGRVLRSTSDTAQAEMARGRVQHIGGGYVYEITPEAEKLATEARAWVIARYSPALAEPTDMSDAAIMQGIIASMKAANTQLSDFEHNLLSCARAEAIEPRLCGTAAYIIEAYRRSQPRPQAAQLDQAGLSRIFKMFEAANPHLKHPAIRLVDEQGRYIHLSLAGAASKNAGHIYVKGDRGSDAYYGKISPDGRFFPVRECPATVEPRLLAFAQDPETHASNYGRLTGTCCFCGRRLTDACSVALGYGPVCADHFGLDWEMFPATALTPAPAEQPAPAV